MKARTAILLTIPPLLWAGNAIVGRMVAHDVPPIMLNFLRWAIAFVLLLPFAGPIFRRDSGLWANWQRFTLLGLLGIGLYNALQYLALQSSTPINVTLVASGMPVWMMLTGWLFLWRRRVAAPGCRGGLVDCRRTPGIGTRRMVASDGIAPGGRRYIHDPGDDRLVFI